MRRPLTPTGTNLLGLVKHLAGVELGYLVEAVGREAPVLPWNEDGSVWRAPTCGRSRPSPATYLVGLYRAVSALTDASIAALPLDAPATVAWWPEERRDTTFGHLLVRCVAETAQHAGHADILRAERPRTGRARRDRDGMGDAAAVEPTVARIRSGRRAPLRCDRRYRPMSATDAAWLAPAPTSAASCTASMSWFSRHHAWPPAGSV